MVSKKAEIKKKYGEPRIKVMFAFLEKLTRYYDFPNYGANLYDFLEDLEQFTDDDIKSCLVLLKERESTYRIKFNEIFNYCKEAKKIRVGKEEETKPEEKTTGINMPDSFKKKYINPIFDRKK